MKLIYLFFFILFFSFSLKAQPKTSSQTSSSDNMQESIRKAREQEIAYKEAQTQNPNSKPYAIVGASLPAFHVVTWDEKSFFDSDLEPKKPLVLILFNPSCGHCIEVGKQIVDSLNLLKQAEIVFITGKNQLGELKKYAEETGLMKEPKIIVSAENSEVNKYLFEYNGIPQIMVYNRNKQLRKTFYKYASMDSLKYYLKSKK